jgi:hypothetical protein
MIDVMAVAGALAYEHQCWGSDDAKQALEGVASMIALSIPDPRERESFVDAASMSGLKIDYVDHNRRS